MENNDTKTGAELIAAERQRQIDVEGWTPGHDDEHARGQLALAGASYALRGSQHDELFAAIGRQPCRGSNAGWVGGAKLFWPWADEWWKPSQEPIDNLVKAGALIAAEIDRLQRAKTQAAHPNSASRCG